MKENEDKQEQGEKDKDVEQLEMLAFHFTQVCKRLSEDREHWAETGKDLTKSVNNLNETLQKFAQLEKRVAEQVAIVISEGSYNAARIIASSTGEKTKEVLSQQIKTTTDHLSTVIREACSTLTDYKWQVEGIKKWFLFGIIMSSLVGNILAGIGVYHFLGNMQDRKAIEIIKEIRAMKREEKTPASTSRTRTNK